MSSMQIQPHLRTLARERIKQKLLPLTAPIGTWGGPGNGSACSVCDNPIGRDEIEYEMDDVVDGSNLIYRFHLHCHTAWEVEATGSEPLTSGV